MKNRKNCLKKLSAFLLSLALLLAACTALADTPLDEANFPDPVFREIVGGYDKNKDGVITDRETAGVKKLDLSGKGIRDLTGIRVFTKLKNLDVQGNLLTSLDVSGCTELVELICKNNPLLDLNVSGNAKLQHLDSESTYMTALDLSGNPVLNDLCVTNMASLTGLSLAHNPKMKKLWTLGSGLTDVSIGSCPELVEVYGKGSTPFGDGYMYSDKNWNHVLVVNGNAAVTVAPEMNKVRAESLADFKGTWELDCLIQKGVTYTKAQLKAAKIKITTVISKDKIVMKSSKDSASATIELNESDGSLKATGANNSIDYFYLLEDGHLVFETANNSVAYFTRTKK